MSQYMLSYIGGEQPASPEAGAQHMAKYMSSAYRHDMLGVISKYMSSNECFPTKHNTCPKVNDGLYET